MLDAFELTSRLFEDAGVTVVRLDLPDTVHSVKNVGSGNAAELATYIVEKGKPFLVLVD